MGKNALLCIYLPLSRTRLADTYPIAYGRNPVRLGLCDLLGMVSKCACVKMRRIYKVAYVFIYGSIGTIGMNGSCSGLRFHELSVLQLLRYAFLLCTRSKWQFVMRMDATHLGRSAGAVVATSHANPGLVLHQEAALDSKRPDSARVNDLVSERCRAANLGSHLLANVRSGSK